MIGLIIFTSSIETATDNEVRSNIILHAAVDVLFYYVHRLPVLWLQDCYTIFSLLHSHGCYVKEFTYLCI